MAAPSRRSFLSRSLAGLAVAGAGGALILKATAQPTPEARSDHDLPDEVKLTEANILGPFYRTKAPFRGKVSPPMSEGVTMAVAGRVWSFDTKRPLSNAVLDVWQADHHGRYDNDDRSNPPAPDVFVNRARVGVDETGFYEFETIHPGRYLNGPKYRPAHIHFRINAPGHRELVTQLYFEGDPEIEGDPFVRESLIVPLREMTGPTGTFESAAFDIVLAKV